MEEMMELLRYTFERHCENGDYNNIEEYLKRFPEFTAADEGYYFSLAADTGNLNLLKLFVDHGAKIDSLNNIALSTCAYENYRDCVVYLLEKGANIEDIKDRRGYKNAQKIYEEYIKK
jgi:ankyrin repeat protein